MFALVKQALETIFRKNSSSKIYELVHQTFHEFAR